MRIIKIFLLTLLILPKFGQATHLVVQGNVSGEWTADTILVTGDIMVPDGQILLINAGSLVEFQGSFAFYIEGSVNALGSEDDGITFTVADTAGFGIDSIPGGGWRGIRFDHNRITNDSSVFEHCTFNYGKMVSEDPLIGHGGAFYVNAFDKIRISKCEFRDNFATFNGGAIYLDSASIIVCNSSFIDNRCGPAVAPWGYGGAICSDNSNPDIRWNTFEGNSSTGVGGALAVRFEDCNVYNNNFTGNFSALGGALGVLHIPEINHRINTNFFTENTALYFGGGVANLNASPIYINNTIANNSAAYGGGFYCKDSISPDFYNTIIWGNTAAVGPQGYLFEVYAQADFFNCDVEGGPAMFGGSGGGEAFFGAYEFCIDQNPDFLGFGEFPFSITINSPCFNAGSTDTAGYMLPATDLEYNPRVVFEIIDIGADEVYPFGVEDKASIAEQVKCWPNPANTHFKVHPPAGGSKFKVGIQRIEVLDISGQILLYQEGNCDSGVVEINISHLPPGIYFVRVLTENTSAIRTLIKVSR